MTDLPETSLLRGRGGSAGHARGPARIVTGPSEFAQVRVSDVLVCRMTDPAWTPLFSRVAAVVTETGGMLSHAAIVAREQGIPAVLGVSGATSLLPGGTMVDVDGRAGTIRWIPPDV